MIMTSNCLLNFLEVVKNGKKLSIGVSYLKLCLDGKVHSVRSVLPMCLIFDRNFRYFKYRFRSRVLSCC